jgi:hypothetical protein
MAGLVFCFHARLCPFSKYAECCLRAYTFFWEGLYGVGFGLGFGLQGWELGAPPPLLVSVAPFCSAVASREGAGVVAVLLLRGGGWFKQLLGALFIIYAGGRSLGGHNTA